MSVVCNVVLRVLCVMLLFSAVSGVCNVVLLVLCVMLCNVVMLLC